MTDEYRKGKYPASLIEGMHYTECGGRLILIPDRKPEEQYEFTIGQEAYTGRQKRVIDKCLLFAKECAEKQESASRLRGHTKRGGFARGWNG